MRYCFPPTFQRMPFPYTTCALVTPATTNKISISNKFEKQVLTTSVLWSSLLLTRSSLHLSFSSCKERSSVVTWTWSSMENKQKKWTCMHWNMNHSRNSAGLCEKQMVVHTEITIPWKCHLKAKYIQYITPLECVYSH